MSELIEFKPYFYSKKYLTGDDINNMIEKTEHPVYIDDYNMILYNGKCYKPVD